MNQVIEHYNLLIEEGNDPVRDPRPLQDYMDKWDGQDFIDKLKLDKTKSVLEIGVGTGRLAVKVVPLCGCFFGIAVPAALRHRIFIRDFIPFFRESVFFGRAFAKKV